MNILAKECLIILHLLKAVLCLNISNFLSMTRDAPYSYLQLCAMFFTFFFNLGF